MTKFVKVQLSNPPSGPSIMLSEESANELTAYFRKSFPNGNLFFKPEPFLGTKGAHSDPICVMTVSNLGANDSRQLTMYTGGTPGAGNPSRFRISFSSYRRPIFVRENGEAFPPFGTVEVKLWMEDRTAWIEMPSPATLPNPISRPRWPKEAEAPDAPPAPAAPTALVLVSLAGKDFEFNLPQDQAFSLALEWTEKGYKS